jgi:hypothetical protein
MLPLTTRKKKFNKKEKKEIEEKKVGGRKGKLG